MSELCSSCTLRGELCAVQATLGPLAAEAAVISDAADTFYEAATDLETEGLRGQEIARLELNMHDSIPDVVRNTEEGKQLARNLISAVSATIRASAMKHSAMTARLHSEDGENGDLVDHADMAKANTSVLDRTCGKGPKADGSCRAPYYDRWQARRALKLIKRSLPDTQSE